MKITLSKKFEKHFLRRIKTNQSLVKRFESRVVSFIQDPNDPILRNHQLTGGKKEMYAFSITGDIRVLYVIIGDEVWFVDIGTHNQVY